MKLWTVFEDYFATGEGRTLMACIVYATNKKEALAKFEEQFGDYYVKGATAEKGVVRNTVTEFVFSKDMLEMLTNNEGKATLVAHGSLHFNFS